MTTAQPDRLDRIESLLERLDEDFNGIKTEVTTLKTEVTTLKTEVTTLKTEVTRTNDRVEVYQKASQQVVNLAFGLLLTAVISITTAALSILIPAILGS